MDNEKVAAELAEIAGLLSKKAANDPWAAKREIARRLRDIASDVEDIYISEDAYVFGDFGPAYKRNVNSGMKQLDGLTSKLESAVKKTIDKIEG